MDNQSINNHAKYLNHILLGNIIDSWLVSKFNTFLPGKNPAIWNNFNKFIAFCWSLPKGPKRTWMKVYKPFELWESTKMTWRYAMNAFYAFWSMIDGNLRHFLALLIHPILIYVFAFALRTENLTKQIPFKMLNR